MENRLIFLYHLIVDYPERDVAMGECKKVDYPPVGWWFKLVGRKDRQIRLFVKAEK